MISALANLAALAEAVESGDGIRIEIKDNSDHKRENAEEGREEDGE